MIKPITEEELASVTPSSDDYELARFLLKRMGYDTFTTQREERRIGLIFAVLRMRTETAIEQAVAEDREHQPAYQWALGERNLLIAALKGQEYLGERYNPPTEALKDLVPFTGDHISHRLKVETEALGKIRQSIIDLKQDIGTIAEGSFTLATRMSDSLSRIEEAMDILVHK